MAGRLDGKVCLITGAGQGLGLATAQRFAAEGARLVLVDMNGEAVTAAAGQFGENAIAVAADVTKAGDVERSVRAAVDAFSRVDVLVNSAGISHPRGDFDKIDEEAFDKVFAVNVKSIFHYLRAIAPVMRQQGSGVIINLGSTAGNRPRPGLAWYNATKGAVHNITKGIALELASDGIRVCAIAPVATETPLLSTLMGGDTPERREAMTSIVPLGRLGAPEDIANAALYLASDEAGFLTGVILEVDGGRSI